MCMTCCIVVNPDYACNVVVVLYNSMLPNIVKLCVTFLSAHTWWRRILNHFYIIFVVDTNFSYIFPLVLISSFTLNYATIPLKMSRCEYAYLTRYILTSLSSSENLYDSLSTNKLTFPATKMLLYQLCF